MNVINLNSPYINELRSTLVGVLKSFLARSAYPQYSPYVQVTPPPQGYQQGYQQPPQSQIIIVQPPAPQVVFSDGRVETGPKDGYGKFCLFAISNLFLLFEIFNSGDGSFRKMT